MVLVALALGFPAGARAQMFSDWPPNPHAAAATRDKPGAGKPAKSPKPGDPVAPAPPPAPRITPADLDTASPAPPAVALPTPVAKASAAGSGMPGHAAPQAKAHSRPLPLPVAQPTHDAARAPAIPAAVIPKPSAAPSVAVAPAPSASIPPEGDNKEFGYWGFLAALSALVTGIGARRHWRRPKTPAALPESAAPAAADEPVLVWQGRPRKPAKPAATIPAGPVGAPALVAGGDDTALPDWLVRPATIPQSPAANVPAIDLAFTATRFSIALSQVVLRSRLGFTNASGAALGPVTLCGDMIAASDTAATALDGPFPPVDSIALPDLHQLLVLQPGQSGEVTGDLHLSLGDIPGMMVGGAKLFVPLVRFRAEAHRVHNPASQPAMAPTALPPVIVCASFLLGEALANSPEGLAPIRLDLGPRIIHAIAAHQLLEEARL